MAWRKICKLKQYGGLGIPRLKDVNDTVLAKQVWKLVHQQPDDLATDLLSNKYGGWGTFVQDRKRTDCSVVWRSMARVASWILRHVNWKLGDGQKILFCFIGWARNPYSKPCVGIYQGSSGTGW